MTVSGYQRYTRTFDAPAGATARVWFNFGNQPEFSVMLDGIGLVAESGPVGGGATQ